MQGTKQAKKRSLWVINEHFEAVLNAVEATQIVFIHGRTYSPILY